MRSPAIMEAASQLTPQQHYFTHASVRERFRLKMFYLKVNESDNVLRLGLFLDLCFGSKNVSL